MKEKQQRAGDGPSLPPAWGSSLWALAPGPAPGLPAVWPGSPAPLYKQRAFAPGQASRVPSSPDRLPSLAPESSVSSFPNICFGLVLKVKVHPSVAVQMKDAVFQAIHSENSEGLIMKSG